MVLRLCSIRPYSQIHNNKGNHHTCIYMYIRVCMYVCVCIRFVDGAHVHVHVCTSLVYMYTGAQALPLANEHLLLTFAPSAECLCLYLGGSKVTTCTEESLGTRLGYEWRLPSLFHCPWWQNEVGDESH